ncbi:single-stranded-DNA-specific exonuclease RecJ [Ligilactobacillus salitolerans]|uniref:Single-stranded-DNA-specific exonuclease RecJ n=1 Tax=Ligilactobacillus salitolerans TaxID=1808352 RepID=A0A401IRE8_9LACO|nr:single-stranded-DNA-specific exonuclease RecJ [Ligilactobacillus salitolerans]GBG94101.1 single-stranded-DNA-specific exonuclease RecJ [Ligilactobacillus salitolerans]
MFESQKQWNFVKNAEPAKVKQLVEQTNEPQLAVAILAARGYDTPEKIKQFLHPQLEMLNDPFLLHDMEKACERIKKAIMLGEKIVVYGDYDADGLTSTSIMYEALLQLGGDVKYYIPDRFTDGYGPNQTVYQKLIEDGAGLIVTVDNGVSGTEAVNYAQDHGVDVVITDHHELPQELPRAYAIVHPRHPEQKYPFPDLSGAGVAFKTATALLEEVPQEMLDLAAIGTVADVVSLTGENRVLVSLGLQVLQQTERIGLLDLYKKAGVDQKTISAETIGFALAPRLNALGRLKKGAPGVELLTTFDESRAGELAEQVQQLNIQRQELVGQITLEALEQLHEEQDSHLVNLIVGEGWHEGVLGIVASRIVDATGKPTLILSVDPKTGLAKGSGRSIEAFDLFKALDGHRDQLISFGGHHMACGLTIKQENRSTVQKILDQEAGQQNVENAPLPSLDIAGKVELGRLSLDDLKILSALEPFGEGNKRPVFKFTKYQIDTAKPMGKENNHLRLLLRSSAGQQIAAVFFGIGAEKLSEILQSPNDLEFVGYPTENVWQGRSSVQIRIVDLKLTQSQPTLQVIDQRIKKLTVDLFQQPGTYAFFEKKIMAQVKRYLPSEAKAIILPETKGVQTNDLFLVDCPKDLRDLQKSLGHVQAKRIHMLFYHQYDLAEIGMPKRAEFAALYRFVIAHKGLDFKSNLDAMAKYLKLSKELMIFMFQVFFEVGFVKIENGLITGVPAAHRVDLKETSSYHSRKLQVRTQEILLHSKSADLVKWVQKQTG